MANEELFNELKKKGIEVALLKKDGRVINSTINMSENSGSLLSSIVANAQTLGSRMHDKTKQIQIGIGDSLAIVFPFEKTIFFALTKNQDDKKLISEFAEKIRLNEDN